MSAVLSMTGFANVDATLEGGRGFGLTMKSVNHRHLDLSIRVPMGMDALEPALRKAVKADVRRGHIELPMNFEKVSASAVVELDDALLWNRATLGVVAISNSMQYLSGQLREVEEAARRLAVGLGCEIVDSYIESELVLDE